MRNSCVLKPICILGTMISATAEAETPAIESAPTAPSIEESRAILDNSLVDYPATRFRGVRAVRTGFTDKPDLMTGYCGELNTKNRMGGYTGWSMFFLSTTPPEGLPDKLLVFGMKSSLDAYAPGMGNKLVATFCAISAKPISSKDYSQALAYSRS